MSATILKYPAHLAVHMGNATASRTGLVSPSAWRGASMRQRYIATHLTDVTPTTEKPRGLPWGTIISALICCVSVSALMVCVARWFLQ